jgi:hypothetical protein
MVVIDAAYAIRFFSGAGDCCEGRHHGAAVVFSNADDCCKGRHHKNCCKGRCHGRLLRCWQLLQGAPPRATSPMPATAARGATAGDSSDTPATFAGRLKDDGRIFRLCFYFRLTRSGTLCVAAILGGTWLCIVNRAIGIQRLGTRGIGAFDPPGDA